MKWNEVSDIKLEGNVHRVDDRVVLLLPTPIRAIVHHERTRITPLIIDTFCLVLFI